MYAISLAICLWLTSLRMLISGSIHAAANGISSSFTAEEESTVCTDHIFIQSSVHGHWPCFRALAIVTRAAMNLGLHAAFEVYFWPDSCPRLGLANHMVVLFVVFEGTSLLSSTGVAPAYSPTNSVGGFPFLHTLFSIYYLQTFWWWSFWLIVVLMCMSLIITDVEHLFMCLLASGLSSLEKSLFRSSGHFFIGLGFFFYTELHELFAYFWRLISCLWHHLQIRSPIL